MKDNRCLLTQIHPRYLVMDQPIWVGSYGTGWTIRYYAGKYMGDGIFCWFGGLTQEHDPSITLWQTWSTVDPTLDVKPITYEIWYQ